MFRVLSCFTGEHDLRLVVLAGLICLLASFAAVSLFQRAHATQERARSNWIITAGVVTGCGIWSTHFIAMLACDPGLVVVSVVMGIVLGVAALMVASKRDDARGTMLAATLLTLSIVSHHFTALGAVEI